MQSDELSEFYCSSITNDFESPTSIIEQPKEQTVKGSNFVLFDNWHQQNAHCSLCNSSLTIDTKPFLLSCMHNACADCVSNSDCKVKECGTCKKRVNISEAKLNVFLMRSAGERIKCDNPNSDPQFEKYLDQLWLKNDLIGESDRLYKCSNHNDKMFDMFCLYCQQMACSDCIVDDHFAHYQCVKQSNELFDPYRKALNLRSQRLNYSIKELKLAQKVLMSKEDKLAIFETEISSKVKDLENRIIKQIRYAFDELRSEVKTAIKRERLRIGENVLTIKKNANEIKNVRHVINCIIKQNFIPAILENAVTIDNYINDCEQKIQSVDIANFEYLVNVAVDSTELERLHSAIKQSVSFKRARMIDSNEPGPKRAKYEISSEQIITE